MAIDTASASLTDLISPIYQTLQRYGLYTTVGGIFASTSVVLAGIAWKSKNLVFAIALLIISFAWLQGWRQTQDRNQWFESQIPMVPDTEIRYHVLLDDEEQWELRASANKTVRDLAGYYGDHLPSQGWRLLGNTAGEFGPKVILAREKNILLITLVPDTSYLQNQGPRMTYDFYTRPAFEKMAAETHLAVPAD